MTVLPGINDIHLADRGIWEGEVLRFDAQGRQVLAQVYARSLHQLRLRKHAVAAALAAVETEHEHTCDDGKNGAGDGECLACGARDCPHGEPLHYHHDGCPSCDGPHGEGG